MVQEKIATRMNSISISIRVRDSGGRIDNRAGAFHDGVQRPAGGRPAEPYGMACTIFVRTPAQRAQPAAGAAVAARFATLLAALAAATTACDTADAGAPAAVTVADVNPLIGTGGGGFWGAGTCTPGAARPYGMVRVSPDTQGTDSTPITTHHAGYYYHDEWIAGFSQTHMHGVGVTSYGHVLMRPRFGPELTGFTSLDYRSRYNKASERVEPGLFAVTLDDGIRVELTATDRVAFHRYTYPEGTPGPRCVLIDVTHPLPTNFITNAELTIDPVAGRFTTTFKQIGGFSFEIGGLVMYAAGRFPPNPSYVATWNPAGLEAGRLTAKGSLYVGAVLCWDNVTTVEMQVGMSFARAAGAEANLAAETAGATFDGVRAAAAAEWNRVLGRVRVDAESDDRRVQFASALYRTLLMPTLMNDVDGTYLGYDRKLHTIDAGRRYYSDFSLWDTYRTMHPFVTIVYPEYQSDFVNSMLLMARQGGYLPKWAFANGETNIMVGTPADIVIADSALKGIAFDENEALDFAMKLVRRRPPPDSEYLGRESFSEFMSLGYIPADVEKGSVSKTQEYAVADGALCNLARKLNRSADAAVVCETRNHYKNLFDAASTFFLPRNRDGSTAWPDFTPESIPADVLDGLNQNYTEGNPWHYRFFAPHDPDGLTALFGGPAGLIAALDDFFARSRAEHDALPADRDGRGAARRYYWHGNEPGLHTAWLYSAAGRPDTACRTLRWIMDTHYNAGPDGLPGNDDSGTLSAWLLFAMLGFYPDPGSDLYWLACPRVRRAELPLAGGVLRIRAEGPLDGDVVPSAFRFNGRTLPDATITWPQIRNGGDLVFVLERRS